MLIFNNRENAGSLLYEKLRDENTSAEIVIALPRGGVPVASIIAEKMNLPLRLTFIRKIGHPVNPEYAIGAVSESDLILNDASQYGTEYLKKEIISQRKRIIEMQKTFKNGYVKKDVSGKKVLLTDDGIATGTCMELVIKELREHEVSSVRIAAPVCPYNTYNRLIKIADGITCLFIAQNFLGIGSYYNDFTQLTDAMVVNILNKKKAA